MQIWVMLPENSEIQRPPEVALELVCTYWFNWRIKYLSRPVNEILGVFLLSGLHEISI
jgi:hypothetical protein